MLGARQTAEAWLVTFQRDVWESLTDCTILSRTLWFNLARAEQPTEINKRPDTG